MNLRTVPPLAAPAVCIAHAVRCAALLSFLIVGLVSLSPKPLHAQDPICALGDGCYNQLDIIWTAITMHTIVTPESGGSMGGDGPLTVRLPANAVAEPLTLSFTSTLTTVAPVAGDVVGLGYFTLAGSSASGESRNETLAAWTFTMRYSDCADVTPCLLQSVDEASLRCLWLDAAEGAWLPVKSHTDVFANRVTCSTTAFGQFALVATPLYTSGVIDQTRVFLPLLHGGILE